VMLVPRGECHITIFHQFRISAESWNGPTRRYIYSSCFCFNLQSFEQIKG
jgi:hypothetical protein